MPRLVDVLPNGPVNHPTVQVFLAGGVPEVMLHLRGLGLLHEDAMTVAGAPLGGPAAAPGQRAASGRSGRRPTTRRGPAWMSWSGFSGPGTGRSRPTGKPTSPSWPARS